MFLDMANLVEEQVRNRAIHSGTPLKDTFYFSTSMQ